MLRSETGQAEVTSGWANKLGVLHLLLPLRTCITVLRVVALFQSLESSKQRMMYSCTAAASQERTKPCYFWCVLLLHAMPGNSCSCSGVEKSAEMLVVGSIAHN
eukprot:GHRQ01028030.1.p2 GENE.GHRQ01028030.1~~GHRQ01028030.1.p2  ORF type:complete len:104 (+),score=11.85 GHRQ01028030.1:668-979(+)